MTTKVNDLARVTYFEPCDHPRPGAMMELTILSTGESVCWNMNSRTKANVDMLAPVSVGDVIAVDASIKDGRLQRVRFCSKGQQFRGDAFHAFHANLLTH